MISRLRLFLPDGEVNDVSALSEEEEAERLYEVSRTLGLETAGNLLHLMQATGPGGSGPEVLSHRTADGYWFSLADLDRLATRPRRLIGLSPNSAAALWTHDLRLLLTDHRRRAVAERLLKFMNLYGDQAVALILRLKSVHLAERDSLALRGRSGTKVYHAGDREFEAFREQIGTLSPGTLPSSRDAVTERDAQGESLVFYRHQLGATSLKPFVRVYWIHGNPDGASTENGAVDDVAVAGSDGAVPVWAHWPDHLLS